MYSLVIIDDEIEQRNGLVYHFPWEKFGFKVSASFGSGQEALDWFQNNTANVVLTDIRMPFINGLQLVRDLKQLKKESIVFCLLSAHKDFTYAKEGIELGVRHYLVKPTDFDEIGEAFQAIREELDLEHPKLQYQKGKSPHIREAVQYISNHPEKASLQCVSDIININPSYLSRLFKDETGENFSAFLNRVRMEKAAELLKSHVSYSNKEIAELLGYQDSKNFYRSFRKHFHETPKEFRKKYYFSIGIAND